MRVALIVAHKQVGCLMNDRFPAPSAPMSTRPGAREFASRFLGGTCENRLAINAQWFPCGEFLEWQHAVKRRLCGR